MPKMDVRIPPKTVKCSVALETTVMWNTTYREFFSCRIKWGMAPPYRLAFTFPTFQYPTQYHLECIPYLLTLLLAPSSHFRSDDSKKPPYNNGTEPDNGGTNGGTDGGQQEEVKDNEDKNSSTVSRTLHGLFVVLLVNLLV